MNLTVILSIVAGFAILTGIAGLEGHLLLKSHEEIGNLKVENRNKQAIIDQNKKDADLSEKLAAYQTTIETALRNTSTKTRQDIVNAPTDNDAAAAALVGVQQLRAGLRPGDPSR